MRNWHHAGRRPSAGLREPITGTWFGQVIGPARPAIHPDPHAGGPARRRPRTSEQTGDVVAAVGPKLSVLADTMPGMTHLAPIRDYWNSAASTFDDEVDHGLREPAAHEAWAALFRTWIPAPSRVLDLGCGTGSLSVLLAGQDHRVTGVDLSPRMIELARAKAGSTVDFLVGDASAPEVAGPFDVVVVRHLLWTLADPVAALHTWHDLLAPGGRFVLVEGRWAESAQSGGDPYVAGAEALPWQGGVPAATLAAEMRTLAGAVEVHPLTDPVLWGKPVTDERYVLMATR